MDNRRDFLRKIACILSAAPLVSAARAIPGLGWLPGLAESAEAASGNLVWVEGKDPYKNTLKALDQLGGMQRFVKQGQRVTILPNAGWARAPELAGCTNPRVVRAVIDECEKAGAKSVTLFCNPCNDARVSLEQSGIGAEVDQTKARFEFINDSGWVKRNAVRGCTHIRSVQVYRLVPDCDVLINVPIAKHHGSSQLTMCCKNLMGTIKDRGYLHQSLHEGIADLAMMFPSNLCVLDATRILVRGGPSSGNPNDVAVKNTVIAGVNAVQVDALGTALFGKKPSEIGYLKLLGQRRYSEIDPAKLKYSRVKA
jgi:uncharacterized protein (DUF362 family)